MDSLENIIAGLLGPDAEGMMAIIRHCPSFLVPRERFIEAQGE